MPRFTSAHLLVPGPAREGRFGKCTNSRISTGPQENFFCSNCSRARLGTEPFAPKRFLIVWAAWRGDGPDPATRRLCRVRRASKGRALDFPGLAPPRVAQAVLMSDLAGTLEIRVVGQAEAARNQRPLQRPPTATLFTGGKMSGRDCRGALRQWPAVWPVPLSPGGRNIQNGSRHGRPDRRKARIFFPQNLEALSTVVPNNARLRMGYGQTQSGSAPSIVSTVRCTRPASPKKEWIRKRIVSANGFSGGRRADRLPALKRY